jgi:hypothetical protein
MQARAQADARLNVGVFAVDASLPIGSPIARDRLTEVVHPLSCLGIVLIGDGQSMVLCAVDWIGICSDGHAEFRAALAQAAGTTRKRVAVGCTQPSQSRRSGAPGGRLRPARAATSRSPRRLEAAGARSRKVVTDDDD